MKHLALALLLVASPAVAGQYPNCAPDEVPGWSGDGPACLGTIIDVSTSTADLNEQMPIALTDLVKAAAIIRFKTHGESGGIADAIERAAAVLEKCARRAADGLPKASVCEALK